MLVFSLVTTGKVAFIQCNNFYYDTVRMILSQELTFSLDGRNKFKHTQNLSAWVFRHSYLNYQIFVNAPTFTLQWKTAVNLQINKRRVKTVFFRIKTHCIYHGYPTLKKVGWIRIGTIPIRPRACQSWLSWYASEGITWKLCCDQAHWSGWSPSATQSPVWKFCVGSRNSKSVPRPSWCKNSSENKNASQIPCTDRLNP